MGNIFNNPKFQAIDSSGLPLSGGEVYTYEAGTTTPKTTYSDEALTTPNANPVVLDSRGEATIYFSSGTYKVVLKDSGGNTIWTEDDLTGVYNPSSLGTASAVDVGTSAGEVPQNSDLGTSAYKDTGVDIGDVLELESVGGSAGLPAVNGSQLTGLRQVPVGGTIIWHTSTPPSGFLVEDGSDVSRTYYSALFAVIGTTYGVGNGSSTFNLPDFRGYFQRGWDNGAGNDQSSASRTDRGDGTTGDYVGTKQESVNKSHGHEFTLSTDNTGVGNDQGGIVTSTTSTVVAPERPTGSAGTGSKEQIGASGVAESRPLNINVMYCIKY